MGKSQSVRSVFFRYVLWLVVISAILSGLLRLGMEWRRSRAEFSNLRKNYLNSQKAILKQRVEAVFCFIHYQRIHTEEKIRGLISDWTTEAKALIRLSLQTVPRNTPLKNRQRQTIAILKKLEPPTGFGIVAIDTMTKKQLISTITPALSHEQILAILNHTSGSPFETDGLIGEAAEIPGARLYIAILEPRSRQEEWMKHQVLQYAASLRFGKEGYIFINTFDGIPLLRDGKRVRNGKSMWELTDPNGVKVLQEEYRAATKNGGDFIYYSWRKLTSKQVTPKMSYIRGLTDWKWMIGTGSYLDEVNAAINARKAEVMRRFRLQGELNLLAFLLIIGIIFLMTKRMGSKLSSEFDVFSTFFRDCTVAHRPIDIDSLKLDEFKLLAAQANRMIESRKEMESALRKSEEKFHQLFEKSRDAMSILSREGFIDCNEALLTLFHASDKTEMFVPPWKLSPEFQPDGQLSEEKAKLIIQETYEKGNARFEWLHRKFSGEEFWCEITLTRIPWDEEDCIFVIWRDITESKTAMAKLQKSEARLRKSQELSRAGNWEVDLINNHYIASDEAYRIYGYTAIGAVTPFEEVARAVHPEDRKRVEEEFRDFIIRGTPYDTTFRIRRFNDGAVRYIRSMAERVTDKNGRATHILGVIQDITEFIEKEREARTEHEKMRITLTSMASGVIVTDKKFRIELMNPVAEELTGYPESRAIGKPLGSVYRGLDPETRTPFPLPDMKEAMEGGGFRRSSTVILLGENNEEHIVLCSCSPIQWKDSGFLGLVLVFRDITERLKMEHELQKTQRLESLGVLAGGIAHDLNNQMTGITGNISLVKAMLKDSPKITSLLNEAEKAGNTCKALARQLLTFASGGAPVIESVDLEELIRESVSFNLRGKPTKAEIKIASPLWKASADPGQFRQIMSNLLINAVQAMPDGGTVCVSAENVQNDDSSSRTPSGKYIRITVSDTGPGIDPEIQGKIFDPFFTTKADGSGLGLSTVHSIVKRHGGRLSLESIPGKGTSFSILLPASEENEQAPVEAPIAQTTPALNILLMDDEEIIRDVAQEIFRFLGHSITITTDGKEALNAYKNAMEQGSPYDLVLLDITIPGGMGGKETISQLMKLDPNVKAAVTSGYAQDPIIANFSEYGFCGRLEKPFKIDDIEKLLAALFG
ncbi:MAG: PAS domain S-box protein [Acidobacteria bacterium]|nr:PAS domain S-box protein [Acidobacteriota bacterium]